MSKITTNKESFKIIFQITKMISFEVGYSRTGSNKNKYFSTSANRYLRNKKDIDMGGQCQESILVGKAKAFWRKWDIKHLNDLTDNEYNLLSEDIQKLKESYNYIEFKGNEADKRNFPFYDEVELSKMKLKKS